MRAERYATKCSHLSDVLANASELSGNSDKVLQLSDPDLEQSLTVDLFLELAVNAKLAIPAADSSHELAKKLLAFVDFLQKYDCKPLWRHLHLACAEQLSKGKLSPQVAFVVSSAARDIDMCAIALGKMCENRRLPLKTVNGLRHLCDADPGTFSLELWNLISHEHAWAYCVAFRDCLTSADHCVGSMCPHQLGFHFKAIISRLPSS